MRNLIFGLARPMLRLLGRDERGAVGVLVAVLVGGGVLLGMAALTIDVGRLYQNRAELQNGADAGALAVAKSCISGTCNTALDSSGVAQPEATANASALTGGNAGVDQILVCFSGQSCTPPDGCPGPPTGGTGYVDVRTSTLLANGSTLLPPVFARALVGNSGYAGTNVKACAQAQWGPAEGGNSLAMTISLCTWQQLTTKFNTLIPLYITGQGNTCADSSSGSNLPGGFAWLSTDTDNDGENNADTDNDGDASNTCNAYINLMSNQTYTNTGANVSSACQTVLENDIASYNAGKPVTIFLPVFSTASGNGQSGTFNLVGLAGFVVTGYSHMNFNPNAMGPANNLCQAKLGKCIEGYFTPGLDPVGPIGSGTNFGATTVKLSG